VLHEVQTLENCEGASGISVVDWSEVHSGANWTVAAYNSGTSRDYECELALQLIVPGFRVSTNLYKSTDDRMLVPRVLIGYAPLAGSPRWPFRAG
jgi:hypothetical protein